MSELAPEIVTRLLRADFSAGKHDRTDWADAVGIGIALAALALALGLALAELTSAAIAVDALPPLTPLAEGHDWNGFSA